MFVGGGLGVVPLLLVSAWPALLNDPHALLETVIIVGIVSVASIGFVTGLRELAHDLGNLRKAKV